MRERNEKGFTLIEVVVVVAVIAILAAVLTPYITKYIDDSKIAKARNEVQVIAAAVTNAYKDLGRWPNRNIRRDGLRRALHRAPPRRRRPSSGRPPAGPRPAPRGIPWTPTWCTNGHTYPATGDTKWSGPYATTLPVDPWGRPYVINAANFKHAGPPAAPIPIWVLSAGPNGIVETNIAAATTATGGDDIGFRVR